MATSVQNRGKLFEADVTAMHGRIDKSESTAYATLQSDLTELTLKFKDIIDKPHEHSATARSALSSYATLQTRIKDLAPPVRNQKVNALPSSSFPDFRLAEAQHLFRDGSFARRRSSLVAALTHQAQS